ncbi:dihydroxy-acid dehydratase [Pontimonas sp.]|nr:IlvD/Edd family dehydratase [Pontimonas sp.]MDA9114370.1 dihydroxy-acid dehydratase [Pontimonas sp.]
MDSSPAEIPSRRSQEWFGGTGRNGFIHRSWMRNQGFAPDVFDGRPVIGIATTWSELTPCNAHLRAVADAVKRGVWEAGALPLEFPVMSLGEPMMRPTTMLYRNLLAMEAEELIRANPLDGVVMLTGCDKTTPGLVMGAASVDLPSLLITGGPMLNGKFRGKDIGSGTDVWKFTEAHRTGDMTTEDLTEAETCMARSAGHCMTMGTASTLASLMETLGLQLSGSAAIPAVDSRRFAMAQLAGRRIVEMVHEGLTMSKIVTRESFENAIMVNAALGGSTNAIVHLLAIAGRLGIDLDLADFDEIGRHIPLLVNLMPAGEFLMEDFYYAGGVPAVLSELRHVLHGEAKTVSGGTIGSDVEGAPCYNRDVISTWDKPIQPAGSSTAVLLGNLAPKGAVLKISAASPHLLKHRGPALVFDRNEDYVAVADDPDLDVTKDTVLVVRNAGPKGYPGFPEVGNMPLPKKLLDAGITDMVRISDGRMSGTGFGTCILHVSPEAASGGPLGIVHTGDIISLDADARTLVLEISEDEMQQRLAQFEPQVAPASRGWEHLYVQHVTGADSGADFDFLEGSSGSAPSRHSH